MAAPAVETLGAPVEAAPAPDEPEDEPAVATSPLGDEAESRPEPADVVPTPAASAPLLSVDEAKAKLGSGILEKLDVKFKGKVAGVRQPDARDLLF